ncbi:hypothetical protein [Nannocystis punicea]|uniref:Uncharacterized protein n=1 Tax=Nannocystis punicea TaxID=2995304 RepID=A0ABY7GUD1_9BACT|nr:hypothetical protein [Nannocystis poenicansa]WAS90570.1 hypothetical protein O0S08_30655 [Nannocystis poenicansa]
MSVNLEFVAKVGKWPPERKDEVLAALKAWAFEDEQFDPREVIVDILGGGPKNPIVRMEAYTTGPIIISGFGSWSASAEEGLRRRIAAAGGEDVSLSFNFPDEE